MIAVVIVLGVAVLVLAAWLYGTRSALRESRERADELDERLEQTTREVEHAMGRVAEAEARVQAESERADAADRAAAAAAKEAENAEAVARAASERALALERMAIDAPGLWALEVVRLDRIWRDHAVAGPEAPSPLAETEDPARAAVEILADAVREDSGTVFELRWKAGEVLAPAPAARLVRACEELFALARHVDTGVVEVVLENGNTFAVRMRTQPALTPPDHIIAAFEAAGCEPKVSGDGLQLRITVPGED